MTQAQASECPEPWELHQFANGQLDPTAHDQIAAHLIRCAACEEKARTGLELEPRTGRWSSVDPSPGAGSDDVDLDLNLDALVDELDAPDTRPTAVLPKGRLPLPAATRRPTPGLGGARPPLRSTDAAPPPIPPLGTSAPVTQVGPRPREDTAVARPPTGGPPPPPLSPPGLPSTLPPRVPDPQLEPPRPVVHGSGDTAGVAKVVPASGGSSRTVLWVLIFVLVLGGGVAAALVLDPDLRAGSLLASNDGDASSAEEAKPTEEAKAADEAEAPDGEAEAPDGEAETPDGEAEAPAAEGDTPEADEAGGARDGGEDRPSAPADTVSPTPSVTPMIASAVSDSGPLRLDAEPVGSRNRGLARTLARRGARALGQRRHDDARAAFLVALAHEPRNAVALRGLAELHRAQGHPRQALRFAVKAVNADPERADLRILLGDTYTATRAFADARIAYEKAAALGHEQAAERLARLADTIAGQPARAP